MSSNEGGTPPNTEDPMAGFVGGLNEDNAVAKTAGEESHEDPWKFADLDAPNSPPEGVTQ